MYAIATIPVQLDTTDKCAQKLASLCFTWVKGFNTKVEQNGRKRWSKIMLRRRSRRMSVSVLQLTSPVWLLWKVSSQGGLEPEVETHRKHPIPPAGR